MPIDKTRLALTWMCPTCGESGVLLRGTTALFTEVMAAVAKDHTEVSPECKADLVISSEEPPDRMLLASFGPKPPGTFIEKILNHWQLPASLLVLVLLAKLIEWWWSKCAIRTPSAQQGH